MAKENYSEWSKEKLIKEIKKLIKRKKYGLVWEDKHEEVAELCKTKLPVLEEDTNKKILTDKQKPVNILIEGDNYHALSVLNYTHKRKIDIIYVDPPYNTGSKDWKYNNNYVDINDQWRHSKWLSFMEKRLKLTKKLLTINGVLICTIDHNELLALGLLLQEIFPEKEVTCVTIVHNPSGIQGLNFSHNNEYAYFVHRKDKKVIAFEERTDETADIRLFMNTAKGINTKNYLRGSGKGCFYPILVKNRKIIGFGDISPSNFHPKSGNIKRKDGIIEIYPIDRDGVERKWVFSRKNVEEVQNELSVKYNSKKNQYDVIRTKKNINYKTVWADNRFNAKRHGTQLLKNIIDKDFPFPKSLYAVRECIKAVVHNENAIILDFFAGSGTTGHAVLDLNEIDGGGRKFILCTNNEDNNGEGAKIAEDICYPRIKNVIQGYLGRLDNKNYSGLSANLKYFRTAFADAEPTDKNKRVLVSKSTEMLCLKEDCFDEVKGTKDFRIFTDSKGKFLGIIYSDSGIDAFKNEAKKMKRSFVVYVFSLDESAREEEFEDIVDLVELKPIPAVILNVYKRIFK